MNSERTSALMTVLIGVFSIIIGLGLTQFQLPRPPKTSQVATFTPTKKPTRTPTPGATSTPSPVPPTDTPSMTSSATETATSTATGTNTPLPTATASVEASSTATDTPIFAPTATPGATFTPWPSAPLCPDHGELHDNSAFHTLWDGERGCHYDHEHGTNPFTPEVLDYFPGIDLQAFLCGVQIGSCNPSSPIENVSKHEGHKWDVYTPVAHPCETGFEGATVGVYALALQYHVFGNAQIEFQSRQHSSSAVIAQCVGDPNDLGYIVVSQSQEFGQRVGPYQGTVLLYPDNPQPPYAAGFGPYNTTDCVGGGPGCRLDLNFILSRNLNAAQKWTSKPTGIGERPETSLILRFLFDVRNAFQVLDWNSTLDGYPFKFLWLCSTDHGETYAQAGCRYTNSATAVHEVAGDVPANWDNLAGWDTDLRQGRVSVDGFVSRFGMPVEPGGCSIPGMGCYPVKMLHAFVGRWGADLCAEKCSFITSANTLDRNICFDNLGKPVDCAMPGAIPSGWIGAAN